MQRHLYRAVVISGLLVACTLNRPPQGASAAPDPARLPTLVSSYTYQSDLQPGINGMRYWPRSAGRPLELDLGSPADQRGRLDQVPAKYTGWDVLIPNNYEVLRSRQADATGLVLTRPAQVALVLRSALVPAWLGDWTPGPKVAVTRSGETAQWPSFVRRFQAGPVRLPGLPNTPDLDDGYLLLIGERGGAATPAPRVPAGRTVPQVGQRCPAWVHDQYQATGPDGQTYPTWHPAIDPVYWCSFGHEHGSAPGPGQPAPLYGYSSDAGNMPAEKKAHGGFKGYDFPLGAGRMYLTQHFGTGGLGRACIRMHTLDMSYVEGGRVRLNYHFMGDFGRGMAVRGTTSEPIGGCAQPDPATTEGVRDLKLGLDGGYEAWRVDLKMAAALGFSSPVNVPTTFTMRTHDPITACENLNCNGLLPFPDQSGSHHSVIFDNPVTLTPPRSGVFWTDAMGMQVVPAGTPGAVKQYAAPGLRLTLSSPLCHTTSAWGGPLRCDGALLLPDKNVEGSLSSAN